MFKVNNKNTRTTSFTKTYFIPFSSVSIVDFEQVISWEGENQNVKTYFVEIMGNEGNFHSA